MKNKNEKIKEELKLNMYMGYWDINEEYKRGDIVYLRNFKKYYICKTEHTSDNLTTPTDDCIYSVSYTHLTLPTSP
jgi:hypothetical protein